MPIILCYSATTIVSDKPYVIRYLNAIDSVTANSGCLKMNGFKIISYKVPTQLE